MPFDQERYEQLRMQLVDRNEANVGNIYLDVLGIPTVGLGVALTARQRDRTMALDENHVNALGEVLNLNPQQRQELTELLRDQLVVQNQHIDQRHNNLPEFLASDFGQDSQRVLGPMVNTRHDSPSGRFFSWDVLTSPESPMQVRLTHEQSLDLFNRVAPEYEERVNNVLRRSDCPAEALSEEQRAAIYSMVYQGATGKARRTADAIGDYWRGEINEEQLRNRLRTTVNDPQFPERSRNELEFLDNIERRPRRVGQNEDARPAALPDEAGNAAGVQPQDEQARQRDEQRRRMIEGDRDHRNEIQFPAPDTQLPFRDEIRTNPRLERVEDPAPGQPAPAAQRNADGSERVSKADAALLEQLRGQVRELDQKAGKSWDDNSERIAASALVMAKEKGFVASDNPRLAFNQKTETLGEGEILHLFRQSNMSPDPYANRANMTIVDALSKPAEQRYQQAETIGQAQAEQQRLAQQQALTRGPDNPIQGAPVRSV